MAEPTPTPRTLVGVVTVLYNSESFLEDFVAGLAAQREVPMRLYAIENSATPETLERLRALAERAGISGEFVHNARNVGVAAANNQGIALALRDGCSHVLIANNDITLEGGVLAALLREVPDWRRAAAPRIVVAGTAEPWYSGGYFKPWIGGAGHHLERSGDSRARQTVIDTEYASTCFLLVHADVFATVGVMDEQYFVYYDDADFAWRCREAGVAFRYVPSVTVGHKVGGSTGGNASLFTIYYANRNRVYFIRKNLGGLRRFVALAYVLGTRILRSAVVSSAVRRETWRGLRDGWALSLPVPGGSAAADVSRR